MQIPTNEIIWVIVYITAIFLIAGGFLLSYVYIYNKRKKKHREEIQTMQSNFEQTLLQSRIEIQEQTFNAISQEIHDNVGQLLSLSKVQLSIAEQRDTGEKELLADIKNNVGQALNDLRDIAKSLSSLRIQQYSFSETVRHEAERINKSGVIHCRLQTEGEEKEIDGQRKIILFRTVQESLQNILKHAAASEIEIRLLFAETTLHIAVSDNGKGFNVAAGETSGRLGLQNIIHRTALIGGIAIVDSAEGKGTTINLTVPYDQSR